MGMTLSNRQVQKQTLVLGQNQQLGIKLLSKSLPELRAEIAREIESNPVLEDIDHPLERPMTEVEHDRRGNSTDGDAEWPTEDFTALARRDDEESIERRQALFDRHSSGETLQSHLTQQLPLADLPADDLPLAEALIGDLDENGYFCGSIPDLCMVYQCDQAKIERTLAAIRELDPPGCGARNLRECLSAQLEKVPAGKVRKAVARLLERLEDVAAGKIDKAAEAEAIAALKRLDPHPGRAFESERNRVEYVNPEIHSVCDENGHWCALTDQRSLPSIRISPRFRSILADPNSSEETKAYLRERIDRARAIQQAVRDRQDTIERIAQAIYDRQQEFFTGGFRALKPMTETEIAKALGFSDSTVSRTVRDKYAATPQGTIELRRFFTSKVKVAGDVEVSQEAVLNRLSELVESEDKSAPLADGKLAELLSKDGFPVARRTIAKYRSILSIPSAKDRRTEKED